MKMSKKNIMIRIMLCVVVIALVTVGIILLPNSKANEEGSYNLIGNDGSWEEYFSGATGTLESTSSDGFILDVTDASSIVNFWDIQAKMKYNNIELYQGKKYTYSSTIKSDKDRTIIFRMIQGSDYVVNEQRIDLQANQEYHYSFDIDYERDISNITLMYFAGNIDDNPTCRQPVRLEVSGISIVPQEQIENIDYENNGRELGEQYRYYSTDQNMYVQEADNNEFKFMVGDTRKLIINGQEIPEADYRYGGEQYIGTGYDHLYKYYFISRDYFDHEYNKTEFFDVQNSRYVVVFIKNYDVTNYKLEKDNEVLDYSDSDNSDKMATLISSTRNDISNAETKDEVDNIMNNFLTTRMEYLKEDAIAEIRNLADEFVNSYTDRINNATTEEEINSILAQAREDAKNLKTNNNSTKVVDNSSSIKVGKPVVKAATREQAVKNPVTKEQVYIYFIILFVGIVGILVVGKLFKNKK